MLRIYARKSRVVLGCWSEWGLYFYPRLYFLKYSLTLVTAIMSGKVVVQPTIINFKNFKIEVRTDILIYSLELWCKADFLMQRPGWIKLDSQWLIHKAIMVYKSLNALAPNYLGSKFVDLSSVLNGPIHTNYTKNSYSYTNCRDCFRVILKSFSSSHYIFCNNFIIL